MTTTISRPLTTDEADRYVSSGLSIPELFGADAVRVRVDLGAGRDEHGHFPLILDVQA